MFEAWMIFVVVIGGVPRPEKPEFYCKMAAHSWQVRHISAATLGVTKTGVLVNFFVRETLKAPGLQDGNESYVIGTSHIESYLIYDTIQEDHLN